MHYLLRGRLRWIAFLRHFGQRKHIGCLLSRLDKIFDRFYQAEPLGKRKFRGCGLGLAITKSILELHKGRIWVESKTGEGSKFFFELLTHNKD